MDADADYPPFRGTDINISHQFGGKLRNNLSTEKSAGGYLGRFSGGTTVSNGPCSLKHGRQ